MANIQVGKYLYNTTELAFTAKVLNVLNKRVSGASFVTIANLSEIKSDFGGDSDRAQTKVKTTLRNLRMRNVIAEVQNGDRVSMFKILNKDEALTLIAEGAKIVEKLTQHVADAADITDVSAVKSNSKSKKVNVMSKSTKVAKSPRLFLNPESSKVEPFGAGRPSKLKIACEVNADGKYLNPQAAAAFLENGGKAEDKMTKAELLDMLRKVRAERDAAIAVVEALTATEVSADDADAVDMSDDSDVDYDLELEAEAVDSTEDSAEDQVVA